MNDHTTDLVRVPRRQFAVHRLAKAAIYSVVVIGALVSMFPFAWAFLSSGKDVSELFAYPPTFLPAHPQFLVNYTKLLVEYPFARWLSNSAYIAVVALVGTILSASLVAYSFARFKYPGRDVLFLITLATMMLPSEVTLIPSYQIYHLLGWIDTYNPLIVPSWLGGGAFNIFLMRQFLMGIPNALDEAAEIDGASSWDVFWRVLMPLTKPAIATMATLGFIAQWGNFMGPLIFLNTPEKYTMSLGLRFFTVGLLTGLGDLPKPNLLMGASMVMALPVLVLFVLAQKYFVQGIVTSGIKG